MNAADREADGFPHGTPRGYRDGCRSNGGCLHRGTTLMTCPESSQRYARDKHYRDAYDAGDIILTSENPLDAEAEAKRFALARRTIPGFDDHQAAQSPLAGGWQAVADEQMVIDRTPRPTHKPAATPTTSPEESPTDSPGEVPPELRAAIAAAHATQADVDAAGPAQPKQRKNAWRHGTAYAYQKHGCRCEACTEAQQAKARAGRDREAANLKADHAAALAELERLDAENSRLRADLATTRSSFAELSALKPQAHRGVDLDPQRPSVGFQLVGTELVLTVKAGIGSADVAALAQYLSVHNVALNS